MERFEQSHPDRTSPTTLNPVMDRFINWWLLGTHVLRRGEHARALDILSWVHRYLLWMARAVEGKFQHWLTPSRAAEQEISISAYKRFQKCTAGLDQRSLETAFSESWAWGCELMEQLEKQYDVTLRKEIIQNINAALPGGFCSNRSDSCGNMGSYST